MYTKSIRIRRVATTATQLLTIHRGVSTLKKDQTQKQYLLSKSESIVPAIRSYNYYSQRMLLTSPVGFSFRLKNYNARSEFILKRNFANKCELKSFQEHQIVPDVLDKAPTDLVAVTYGELEVKEGCILTPTQVQNKPQLEWKADAKAFYTLCMNDPDAPSRKEPKLREWLHWLVVNIPGCNVDKGETLAPYLGSGPPKDTGLHRYIFLVYKQPSKLCFDEKQLTDKSPEGRDGFKIACFAEKYKLGTPIAGNFYQAEYDDYVPKFYAKLGVA